MSGIIGISGSLRAGSYNSALLRAAKELRPDRIDIGTIRGIPLYDGDLEKEQGCPPAVEHLRDQIVAADGLLLVTPEYNNSIPGVFKNAIDWLSGPSGGVSGVFKGKPTAVIGASMGRFGTILGQNAWLPVLRALGARQWSGGRLMVARAQGVFDPNGDLIDEELRQRLEKYLDDYRSFIG